MSHACSTPVVEPKMISAYNIARLAAQQRSMTASSTQTFDFVATNTAGWRAPPTVGWRSKWFARLQACTKTARIWKWNGCGHMQPGLWAVCEAHCPTRTTITVAGERKTDGNRRGNDALLAKLETELGQKRSQKNGESIEMFFATNRLPDWMRVS